MSSTRDAAARATPVPALSAAAGHSTRASEPPLASLQSAAGNRAVVALVQRRLLPPVPPPPSGPVTGTAPDHATEREANRIAAAVAGSAPAGGSGREPPSIGPEAAARIRSPGAGEPVPLAVREPVERRLGMDLGDVRVHAGPQARELADRLGARAFAFGRGVWLGSGAQVADRALLAHELVHTAQQAHGAPAIQRQTPPPAATRHRVVVIGSVGPGEISAGNPYQFVNAAVSLGVDSGTIWFVERTGYEAGGVNTDVITRLAGSARLVLITPQNTLVTQLNALPARSIGSFHVFSHGLAGLVTLRYGWEGRRLPNYGLSVSEIDSLRVDLFAADAAVRFDSCNSGTSDWYSPTGNLAQTFANRTSRPVSAWTGRTSYSAVNRAGGSRPAEVEASQVLRGTHVDTTELVSLYGLGRTPTLRTFTRPSGRRVGGFTSTFAIRARLPETRHFQVPAGGAVVVTCTNPQFLDAADGEEVGSLPAGAGAPHMSINLHRSVDWGPDVGAETYSFPVGSTHSETWSGLAAGTYYVEIWRGGNTNFMVSSSITVDVHAAP